MTLLTLAVVGVHFTSVRGCAYRWHSRVFVFMALVALTPSRMLLESYCNILRVNVSAGRYPVPKDIPLLRKRFLIGLF